MQRRSTVSRFAVSVFAAVLITTVMDQARATVTWSFIETGAVCFNGECTIPPPVVPFVFATLTLPGPISQGTALWDGVSGPPPVYTGDDFILSIPPIRLTSAFNGDQGGLSCASGFGGPQIICDFRISWSGTASDLAISISLDGALDNIGSLPGGPPFGGPFGSFGGAVATDRGMLGGCSFADGRCQIIGFWQNGLAVPEPSSASLILTGLLGSWLGKRQRRRCGKPKQER